MLFFVCHELQAPAKKEKPFPFVYRETRRQHLVWMAYYLYNLVMHYHSALLGRHIRRSLTIMNSFQYNAVDNQAISKAIPKHADLIERDQR